MCFVGPTKLGADGGVVVNVSTENHTLLSPPRSFSRRAKPLKLSFTLWREKWPAGPKDPFTHAASRAACAGPMLSADGRALLD